MRAARAPSEIIARLQPKLAAVDGIEVYLQAVQDLQIDSRVSRTQYQYTLEDADPAELAAVGARGSSPSCRRSPILKDVASDQETSGLAGLADDRSRHRFAARHLAAG